MIRAREPSVGIASVPESRAGEVAAKKVQALRGLDASTAQSHEDALMDLCNALFQAHPVFEIVLVQNTFIRSSEWVPMTI